MNILIRQENKDNEFDSLALELTKNGLKNTNGTVNIQKRFTTKKCLP